MATTTPDNLWSPDPGTQYNLTTDWATSMTSVQNALKARANLRKGTAAQRSAFSSQATEGDVWQDTDGTKFMYIRQSGVWVPDKRRDIMFRTLNAGANLTGITRPPTASPESKDLLIQSGYWRSYTTSGFGNEYSTTINFPRAYVNGIQHVSVTPVHVQSETVLGPDYIALDTFSNDAFRVLFPNSTAKDAQRAFLWMAVGFV